MSSQSITTLYRKMCFEFGDDTVIKSTTAEYGYSEIYEVANILVKQLHHRFNVTSNDYVLIDCTTTDSDSDSDSDATNTDMSHLELPAILACIHLGVPFVPISCSTLHQPPRLSALVAALKRTGSQVYGIIHATSDASPLVTALHAATVHRLLYLDSAGSVIETIQTIDILPDPVYNEALYVMFTSGTSGTPKAVVGSHAATVNRLAWWHDTFPATYSSRTVIARRSPLTFVDGLNDLLAGCLFPNTTVFQGVEDLGGHGVSRVTVLPQQLALLTASPPSRTLKHVIVSGSLLTAEQVSCYNSNGWRHVPLINLYGQTETGGDVLYNVVGSGGGFNEITGCDVRVEDGEIVVAGVCCAVGYLGKAKFEGFYRTGDCGTVVDDRVVVGGRLDGVGKVNGIVTCPREVETVFQHHLEVKCTATVEGGVVAVRVEEEVGEGWRGRLRERGVPWHLIPRTIVGGTGAGRVTASSSPVCPVSTMIMVVLNTTTLNYTSSFVDNGGDSMLTIVLVHKLETADYCKLTVADVLSSGSISELIEMAKGSLKPRKKAKVEEAPHPTFTPSVCGQSVLFRACVDAQILVDDAVAFGACQGGSVVKFSVGASPSILAFRDLGPNSAVEGAPILVNNVLCVVSYCTTTTTSQAHMLRPSDLSNVVGFAQVKVAGVCKGGAIVVDDVVVLGTYNQTVVGVAFESGEVLWETAVVGRVHVKPVQVAPGKVAVFSCDWEGGMTVIDVTDGQVLHQGEVEAPVYGEVGLRPEELCVCDMYGGGWSVQASGVKKKWEPDSWEPVFSGVAWDGEQWWWGSHDGKVRTNGCVGIHVGAAVLGRPLVLKNCKGVCVATTAGSVVKIVDGRVVKRVQLEGEVFCSPVEAAGGKVLVGCRDSKVHIIDLN